MLNYLWSGMILIGVLWGAFHGRLAAVTEGALTSAKEAVTLCITMLGVMTLWTGVLEVGKRAGLIDQLSRRMRPVLRFLFPRLSPESEAAKQISVNMIANILGLGWAATPAGLKAMEELKKVEEQRGERPKGVASNEMCTFLIINISSLQLIPINMIAYRSQYGSVNPAAIVGPALAATLLSTVVAVIVCKALDRKRGA
ncbi:nucleoside recognition protein [Enterocloster asparagiformis]|uniref:nucleoside recognition protein n=1 Tax=Enterocloster asparagiformis TaxID=333367 RepID=UPI002A800DB7|nr:nucleoside recognition protein [Enterocloster asparagiformis]